MQVTTNTQAFIEAEQYSDFILMNLHDGLLPMTMYRDVSDFGSGTTLNIKTVGTVTLQEAGEETPLIYNPIESGTITLQITDYVGDAWSVSDDLREDGTNIDMLMAARAAESTRALQETYESRFLAVCEAAQTNADANAINGFAHRLVSPETNGVFALNQLSYAKLSFGKANVPSEGRVFIMDEVAATTLDNLVTITHDVSPFGAQLLQEGMARGQEFVMRLYGWDIITSNRLPKGTFSDGTTNLAGAVANIGMCILDDQCKPIMGAWRRQPKVEGERNKDLARDEFVTRSRWGFGVQRLDTLFILATHATNII